MYITPTWHASKRKGLYTPKISEGNCLRVANNADHVSGLVLPEWNADDGITIFYKALIRSTGPSNYASLLVNYRNAVIQSVYGFIMINQVDVTQIGSGALLEYGKWHEYALTFKKAPVGAYGYHGSFLNTYRDNSVFNFGFGTSLPTIVNPGWGFTLFNDPGGGGHHSDMDVRDFKFFSRGFSPDEIIHHYWGREYLEDESLECYYKLDEGSGIIAHDSSPHHRDLTINGCEWSTFEISPAL